MNTLQEIGLRTGTDKAKRPDGSGHGYLDFYESLLPNRAEKITLIEVGVGGYKYKDRGGESLRMWREFYPNAEIVGIDLHHKERALYPGCFFHVASQNDYDALAQIVSQYDQPDVVIDDASHNNKLCIQTFDIMFGFLKPGGTYIWEDTHTSFWNGEGQMQNEYEGNPEPMIPGTSLHFLARLMYGLQVDSMQEQFREKWDGHIESMHFMRNTCVIKKRKQEGA